jgi:hypothetical protein
MSNEPVPPSKTQWLWVLLIASMAILIVLWFVESWTVETNVQPGAGPGGLTAPG